MPFKMVCQEKKLKLLVLQDFFQAMLKSSIILVRKSDFTIMILQLMNPSFQACKMSASIALILSQKW